MPFKVFKLVKKLIWGEGQYVVNPATLIHIDKLTGTGNAGGNDIKDFVIAYFSLDPATFNGKRTFFTDETLTALNASAKVYFGVSGIDCFAGSPEYSEVSPGDDVYSYKIYKSDGSIDTAAYMDFVENNVSVIAIKPAVFLESLIGDATHDGLAYVKPSEGTTETIFNTNGKIDKTTMAPASSTTGTDLFPIKQALENLNKQYIAQVLDMDYLKGSSNLFIYAWATASIIMTEEVQDNSQTVILS